MDVVYVKLKSAKDFRSIPIDGTCIAAAELKVKIVQSNFYGRGKDFDLLMSDAVTGGDIDESTMIARGSYVLIRRIPGWQQKPIVLNKKNKDDDERVQETEDVPPLQIVEEIDLHDFGPDVVVDYREKKDDLQSYPEVQLQPMSKHEGDERIKSLVNTPSLQGYNFSDYTSAKPLHYTKSCKRPHGCLVLEPKIPPPGYVCHRCNEPGHFIQHCPTNGDRAYDIKLRPVTGIPKSMLQPSSDGLYKLPGGGTAILKPNEDAFDKEMESIISSMTHIVSDLPPELFCPLCKQVMKDAVLSSKCCFSSFCDKCIREHVISKSMCYCGAKDVLADDLIPNITLRETVNAMLFEKSTRSTSGNCASSVTDRASNVVVNGSPPLPPSAAPSCASDNHEGSSTSTDQVYSIVKEEEDRTKNKDKANDTCTRSLDNSDADGFNGVVIHGDKGSKKRKKMTAPVDAGFRMCTSALNNPGTGMYYPFPPATYNAYYYYYSAAGTIPLGFHGYAAYLSAGMPPYVNYASDSSITTVGGIPWQPSYGYDMQGYNFIPNKTDDDMTLPTYKRRRGQLPSSYSIGHSHSK